MFDSYFSFKKKKIILSFWTSEYYIIKPTPLNLKAIQKKKKEKKKTFWRTIIYLSVELNLPFRDRGCLKNILIICDKFHWSIGTDKTGQTA